MRPKWAHYRHLYDISRGFESIAEEILLIRAFLRGGLGFRRRSGDVVGFAYKRWVVLATLVHLLLGLAGGIVAGRKSAAADRDEPSAFRVEHELSAAVHRGAL